MTRIPCFLLLLLPALLASCRSSGGGAEPGGTPAAPPRPAEAAPAAADPAVSSANRMKVYYDLDQYTRQWMNAKAEGNSVTWSSLENSVLRPIVDANEADLLATLGKKEEGRLRIIASRALGFGTAAARIVPALAGVLQDPDPDLVSSALVSLYVQASPDTPIGPLSALLNHPDPDVRLNDSLALYAVLRSRRRENRVPLTDEVKAASGRLLAIVSNPAEDPFIRGHAAAALGEIGDPMATDVLVNLLSDPSSIVRTRAAEGLGQLGQEQALPPLIESLATVSGPTEGKVIVAALERIAGLRGFPVDASALGTDPEKWRGWYAAVRGVGNP